MNKALENLSEDASDDTRDKLKKEDFPDWLTPMKATLTHDHFSDPDWIYERKLDGERCLVFKPEGGKVKIMSRNKKEQNSFYPELADAFSGLEGAFVLDVEVVTFKDNVSSFSKLQKRMHVQNPSGELKKDVPVYAYIFDILHLDGYSLTGLPLIARKKALKDAFELQKPLYYLSHRREDGEKYLKEACEKNWEGIIAKDAESTYVHDRSRKWLKFKCGFEQEFVIGGFTAPEGERKGFGALLVGFYDGEDLMYAGKVGTGYDDEFLKNFREKMENHTRKTCPFKDFDDKEEGMTWLTPHFVGEVGFTEWTDENKLRHPRFLGLRKDKDPKDVVKEG